MPRAKRRVLRSGLLFAFMLISLLGQSSLQASDSNPASLIRETLVLGKVTSAQEVISRFGYSPYMPEMPHATPDVMRYPVTLPGLPTRNLLANVGKWDTCGQCHRMDAPLPIQEQPPQDVFKQLGAPADAGPAPASFTRLTHGLAQERFPIWSPDGAHILYSVQEEAGAWNLWVMKADGSQQRQLTFHASAGWGSWRSDGQAIVYWAEDDQGRGNLWSVELNGVEPVQLTDESMAASPEWSPDGGQIAYMALRGNNWDVWLMKADGADKRQLTNTPELEGAPHWSPRGDQIAFKAMRSGRSEFYLMNFPVRQGHVNYTTLPAFKPLGTVLDAEAGTWNALGTKVAFVMYALEWLPDGRTTLTYKVWSSDANGDNPRLLNPEGTLGERAPRWSPDGQWIGFWAWDRQFKAGVWISTPDGTQRYDLTEQFAADALYPSWAPWSSEIVFDSNRAGNFDIWTVNLQDFFAQ